ncbi:MAG: hypothetical protein IPL12_14650 [Bacteroidetes bacterium]|nr:hypothetical protein [Bacteroidota bacterium]
MNSKITLNLPKAFLFNFWMCIGVYVSGQTSNSEFNAFLKEKQSSSADEKSTPQNLLERPLDSVIRDILIPEWNFKEHLSKLDTVLGHTPVTIEMKRTISKSGYRATYRWRVVKN